MFDRLIESYRHNHNVALSKCGEKRVLIIKSMHLSIQIQKKL